MSKKKTEKRSANKGLAIVLVFAVIVLVAVVCLLISLKSRNQSADPKTPTQETATMASLETEASTDVPENTEAEETSPASETATESVQIHAVQEMNTDLGQNLEISDIGSYVGIYMEDGTDEVVSGVLMIVLTNNGELPLEYAEIELTGGDTTAYFSVSTLPAGASVVLLEKNRMPYDQNMSFSQAEAKLVSFFDKPLSLCEDQLQIQALDGAMNITNISGNDISDDIVIYYKNSSQDMYYGGITYRVRISGGIAAGEIKQIMSDHFSDTGSSIMFVTCG